MKTTHRLLSNVFKVFQISLFLLVVINSPGPRVIFRFADWKATLHVSYFTYYKVILVFIILQIFSTRWKNFNEQHIVCCMGCLLFGILWWDLIADVTRSEINFLGQFRPHDAVSMLQLFSRQVKFGIFYPLFFSHFGVEIWFSLTAMTGRPVFPRKTSLSCQF